MFDTLEPVPADVILKVNARAKADTNPHTVNLSIGEYKDDKGRPYVPATIQEAARQIDTSNFGYTPAAGLSRYLEATAKLLLQNFDTNQIAMQATTGGTGSLSLLRELFKKS